MVGGPGLQGGPIASGVSGGGVEFSFVDVFRLGVVI